MPSTAQCLGPALCSRAAASQLASTSYRASTPLSCRQALPARRQRQGTRVAAHLVEIEKLDGETIRLEVPEGESILEVGLDQGLDLPHDCKMGVCMTCPAKLVAGKVDQTAGMLSDDVKDKGYTLMCVATPLCDLKLRLIEEEELLEEVMQR